MALKSLSNAVMVIKLSCTHSCVATGCGVPLSRIESDVNDTLGVMLSTVIAPPLPCDVENENALLNVASSLRRLVFCESESVVMFLITIEPFLSHVMFPPAR